MNPAWINPVSRSFALSRRFAVIAAMFLSVLLGILIYTITAIKNEQSNVILMDMAGRQGMLFQKHMNEVLLTSQGVEADYTATRELIHSTLNVLMEGGSVGLDTETGQRQTVPSVPSEEILIKLREQQNYFNKIIGLADNFLLLSPDQPEFRPKLQTLRTQNLTLIGIADDAVKQLNAHSESNLATIITWETIIAIFVGLLGVLVTRQGIRDGQRLENEIEERNRAEANLRATEQMYRQVLDSIADMIFVKDQNFRILWANKAFRKYYNMTNEELRGILDAPFNEPEFTKHYNEADAHVFKTGNVLEIPEEPVTRHDGQVNLFHTIKAPLFDENREVVKLVGVARDITERKMSEEQAKRLFRQNELILASAGDGIYGLDLEGRTTFVNPAGANMLGYEPRELVGSFMHGTVHHSRSDGSPYPREECPMYAAFTDGTIHKVEDEVLWRKDGTSFPVEYSSTPIWQAGQLVGAVVTFRDIIERKQAEEVLQESEERYRILYEDNPSMYFTVSQDGKILSVNRFGAQQLGYSVEELVGQPVLDLFLEEEKPQVQQQFEDCLKSPLETFSWEFRKVRKDGSIVWVKEVARAVHNKDGEIEVLIVCEDISDRKETEKALQESKELTESILGQLPKGFAYRCLNNKEWTVIYVSDGIEEVTGYPVSDLLSGRITYDTLMAPGENERVWPMVQDALAKHLPYENEHQIITRDGKKKWILARGSFVFDEKGELLYLDGLNVDISEHKQIQKNLRTSEERFRSLVEHIPFCIHEIELNGKISSMNKAGQQMIGIEDESRVIGRSYLKLTEEKDHSRSREFFEQALQGQPVDFEFNYTKHGKVRYFTKRFVPIRGSDGTVLKIVGISEEITERKEAEKRLLDSETKRTEALRQSDELKSALLSSVSHELRTPLTAIKSSVSSIIGNVPSGMNEVQQELLKGVDREINYMSRLVDNLLDMSRIEAGTLIPHREWHPLEDLVEGALRRTEQLLENRNIEVDIPEEVPPVFVDAVEMQQVFINLLDNAVKYSASDSSIQIHVRVGDRQITVEVTNTGEAIQAQDLERIFERFYRRRLPHEQTVRGTGLGLAICKGIVEAHGGRIWAESAGRGVTIIFTVPVTESMASFSLEGLQKSVT